jgi:hypothetical protein
VLPGLCAQHGSSVLPSAVAVLLIGGQELLLG